MKAIFIDIDNTLLDFDAYVRTTMEQGFAHFGLPAYRPEMYHTFTAENNKLWRQIEQGTLTFRELEEIRWNNVFAALDKSYVDACAGHETAYLTFIAGRAGEYRVLEPGLLRAQQEQPRERRQRVQRRAPEHTLRIHPPAWPDRPLPRPHRSCH